MITGSNANLLSSELATHLTGRHSAHVLIPFSFSEFLEGMAMPGISLGGPQFMHSRLTETEYREALDVYAEQGGYPEPLLKNLNLRDYLRTLLQSTLYQDIVKRFRIRSVQGIEDLAFYLLVLNDRVDRTDTFKWQDAVRPIRLEPLWKWLNR